MKPTAFCFIAILIAGITACGSSSSALDAGVDTDTEASDRADESDGGERPSTQDAMAANDFADPPAPEDEFPVPTPGGLAPTPPMGWNSWNKFGCSVTADDIKDAADLLVESGMADVGYQYVNIDDCWLQAERDSEGRPVFDPDFTTEDTPGGVPELADYVHDLGLKLGIYSDRGTETCAHRAGAEGHEEDDARLYAEWGIDYLKHDNCSSNPDLIEEQYGLMAEALANSGRDIVYSLCAWQFHEWGVGMGHLWRISGDIEDQWESILQNLRLNVPLAAYAGPNGWNDPDMLEVGNGAYMTMTEHRSHFSLWAMMAAPLIAGNDLTRMSDAYREILTNEEVIAVNQDSLGLQGYPVREGNDLSVWVKPLNEAGARAVALFNTNETEEDITFSLEEAGLRTGEVAEVRDLWSHEDVATTADSLTLPVAAHEVVLLKVVGKEPRIPSGDVYLSDWQWTYAANGLGPVERNQAVGTSSAGDGEPISLAGQVFDKGLGVNAPSSVIFRLGANCNRFQAEIGVDDFTDGRGSVRFQVLGDGERLYRSDLLEGGGGSESIDVDLEGVRFLELEVTNGDDGMAWDRASWGDARIRCGSAE